LVGTSAFQVAELSGQGTAQKDLNQSNQKDLLLQFF
jgi:hypothetical protein